jgi:hypothetical protein
MMLSFVKIISIVDISSSDLTAGCCIHNCASDEMALHFWMSELLCAR